MSTSIFKKEYSFLNSSSHTQEIEKLNNMIETYKVRIEKLECENYEFRKANKTLNSQLNLLINENDIVKNLKIDIQNYSDFTTNFTNSEETLKEFFYLLVICEKMKYLNLDYIWAIDSGLLYREVKNLDLSFYEWGAYLTKRLQNEYNNHYGYLIKNNNQPGIFSKLK
jgi:hypothetical protein